MKISRVVLGSAALFALVIGCAQNSVPPSQPLQRSLLSCTWPPGQTPRSESMSIGPAGGTLRVRNNDFRVPAGALQQNVTFTMRELSGDSVGVLITPSVTFARPARVRIDVGSSRCSKKVDRDDWWVWRVPDSGGTGERLRTGRPFLRNRMTAELTQNSYIFIAD